MREAPLGRDGTVVDENGLTTTRGSLAGEPGAGTPTEGFGFVTVAIVALLAAGAGAGAAWYLGGGKEKGLTLSLLKPKTKPTAEMTRAVGFPMKSPVLPVETKR